MRFVLSLFLCLCVSSSFAEKLVIYAQNSEAATYIDTMGELRGKNHGGRQALLTEVVQALVTATGSNTAEVGYYPENGVAEASGSQITALFGLDRSQLGRQTPEKQLKADKWVGPLLSDSVVLLESKDHPTGIKHPNDIKLLDAVCVRVDTAHGALLKEKGIDNVVIGESYNRCWRQLVDGDASLTAISQVLIPSIRQREKTIESNIVNTGVRLSDREAYLAFSSNTPDELILRWQTALDSLKSSMMYHSFIHHYYCQQDCF